ncbi:membrane protein [Burkholderia lata]|uniref:Membrane protein n=1 Tax=Burkholderia lata (strain ATCC 17760 / DSM 23089 / LMG 22485 / NCIMB 9086 / R18194 / 383) TaxID=482957 RepID=A0A6P2P5A9_BURL3|nr:membrane protein [Burkholderia lata]
MKAARILAVAVLAAVPALSFADTGHGLTRADVRAELVRLEKAGYDPARSEPHYPDDIAAALQVVRSDQNGPSKSQGDNVADASAPAGHRGATQARSTQNVADDLYAHS